MVYAGSALRERAKSNYSFDGKLAREGKSLEGKGWTGFSEARWDVWLKRFKLAKERCQDEKTRDLLAKVLSLYGEKGVRTFFSSVFFFSSAFCLAPHP